MGTEAAQRRLPSIYAFIMAFQQPPLVNSVSNKWGMNSEVVEV